MGPLDFSNVKETSTTSSEKSTWEVKLRNSMVSSFIQAPCSVRDAFSSFEDLSYLRVCLESLEFFIRIDVWVSVIKTHNETNVDKIRSHMVQETSRIDITL